MRRRLTVAAVVVASLLGAVAVWETGTASAYGSGALHQVEISASISPNLFGPGTGGGIWLWIELDGTSTTSGGTGDYTGSDCLHHTPIAPFTGAVVDSGDAHWTSDGSTITITGVVIGGDTPVTITVPPAGHLRTNDLSSVFSLPVGGLPGTAQIQVAP